MFGENHQRMLTTHLKGRGIRDPRVLAAFAEVDRRQYVSEKDMDRAFDDNPLPIGHKQTISQPYIVALTVESLKLKPTDRVLELGTGSGYEAAILAELCSELISIERIPELAAQASGRLAGAGYTNAAVINADGTLGHPDGAPYDAIAVSAAAPSIPEALIDQLAPGGRLVIPIGTGFQELIYVEKDSRNKVIRKESICDVRFVPLIGEQGFQ
ncbi:protein-L-isoaspartate(D-aspartate) O-methyltransferase [Planctomycetota bacterium]